MDVSGIETMTPCAKSLEPEAEAATPIHQAKPVSFANGAVKRHRSAAAALAAVSYRECLKNHAAAMGGHSVDGCGEFAPSPSATAADPASLTCAACGCHRNFHRRDPEDPPPPPPHHAVHVIEYQPHHRHRPPPPPVRSPSSASPPPISSSYYPCAPRMLLALSSGGGVTAPPSSASRKRFRTKFTPIQKHKMHEFADRIGWRLQKKDEDLIHEFCDEIGVDRVVLKVWMHNNKNNLGRRSADATNGGDENHNHRHNNEIQG